MKHIYKTKLLLQDIENYLELKNRSLKLFLVTANYNADHIQ